MATTLIARRDTKAHQIGDGSLYHPVRERLATDTKTNSGELVPFTLQDVVDHIEGRDTFGHYMLDKNNNCKFFAFDIDLVKFPKEAKHQPRDVWLADPTDPKSLRLTQLLRCMAEGLAWKVKKLAGIPVAISFSGSKGLHVICLTGSIPAAEARAAAKLALDAFGPDQFVSKRGESLFASRLDDYKVLDIEIYPKQEDVSPKGFGNLMRLPLGINRKRGMQSFFIDVSAPIDQLVPADPFVALESGSLIDG